MRVDRGTVQDAGGRARGERPCRRSPPGAARRVGTRPRGRGAQGAPRTRLRRAGRHGVGGRIPDRRDRRQRSAPPAHGGGDSAACRQAGRRPGARAPSSRGGSVASRRHRASRVDHRGTDTGGRVHRCGARRRQRPRAIGLGVGRCCVAGVRHARAQSHPGADAAGRNMRRRRARGDDVQRTGAISRRVHLRRFRLRGALHRRGSGRPRTVGA